MIKLIYKEKGQTSFQTIKKFAKENNIKKIGHTGTLDPIAKGLLLIATDEDTKLIPYLDQKEKKYIATAKFGFISSTYDSEGEITNTNLNPITLEKIKEKIQYFKGKIKQIPPSYSAKKINGQRAYDLARNNQEFQLNPQEIEIYNLQILNFDYIKQELIFEVSVSRGTYIRSIIHDLGQMLKVGAIMIELERTCINGLTLEDLKNDTIEALPLLNMESLELTTENLEILLKGQRVLYGDKKHVEILILLYKKQIIGFGKIENNFLFSKKLFGNKIIKIKGEVNE